MDLPQRKKNRLEKKIYNSGYFFVTICTKDRIQYFGVGANIIRPNNEIDANNILPNKYGKTIENIRLQIPSIYENVTLDEYIVMPNHIHGIIMIDDVQAINNRPYGTLSQIIKWFKQISSKQLHQSWLKEFQRQKSFHDHIIRNEEELNRIREYIKNNSENRRNDEHYG